MAAARRARDAGRADRRLLLGRRRQRVGVPADLPRDDRRSACRRRGSRRSCSTPAGPTWPRRAPSCRRSASSCSSRRSPAIRPDSIRPRRWRVIEDYKPLDVECASVGLQLCRGIRARYPEWRHLADGDGGDENLKDYPIEENPELTIRSVVDNLMLYQEGWGVGRIKHSLTYSGGLSRSYVRTYAPARRYGFDGFSPLRAARRPRGRRGHPVRGADRLRRADALRAQGRDRPARRPGDHRLRRCRRSPSGASSTARSTRTRCARGSARRRGEAAYRRGFLGLYGV